MKETNLVLNSTLVPHIAMKFGWVRTGKCLWDVYRYLTGVVGIMLDDMTTVLRVQVLSRARSRFWM